MLTNKKRNKGLSHDCKAEVSSQSQITLQLLSPIQHALLTALPNVSALALQIGVGNMLRIDNYELIIKVKNGIIIGAFSLQYVNNIYICLFKDCEYFNICFLDFVGHLTVPKDRKQVEGEGVMTCNKRPQHH